MKNITFLILRRMRAPIIVLIVAYAVSVLGLVLIPGVDEHGQPWRMDFLHAFYFVSYMATTIGFGELPQPFSPAQRLWVTISIYVTVVAWFYAIGGILTLFQNAAFKQALTENKFSRAVRVFRRRFYLVCGYGDTGSMLVQALVQRGKRAVTIDIDPERINDLALESHPLYVPGLQADAAIPRNLIMAGLKHPRCAGLIALTNDDQANLSIAIAGKLLRPEIPVICRAETREVEANMASFGTDHIIDPFDTFAEHLAMAIHASGVWLLHEWLTAIPDTPLAEPLYPPRGMWVICGYGRFGKAVVENLRREGIELVIIEADPKSTGCQDCVVGSGAEARTLIAADIEQAVGIVAGTDNDHTNLSVVMTALELNSDLFVVMRQNRRANTPLFRAVKADLVMQASGIIAHEMIALLTAPLLARFLQQARRKDNDWAHPLISRISGVVGDSAPAIWEVELARADTPGICRAHHDGLQLTVGDLLRDPRERDRPLPAVALLRARGWEFSLLPEDELELEPGDRLLFCGEPGVDRAMDWTLQNYNVACYVLTGRDRPDGAIWRWLESRRRVRGV